MWTKWKTSGVIATVCLMVAAQCAHAQPAPNKAATGQKLAEQYCAQCHVIVPGGPAGWTDAPSFEAIGNRPGTTAAKLSAFIQQQHMHMLNTERPPGEASAIAAYIVSLRKH